MRSYSKESECLLAVRIWSSRPIGAWPSVSTKGASVRAVGLSVGASVRAAGRSEIGMSLVASSYVILGSSWSGVSKACI